MSTMSEHQNFDQLDNTNVVYIDEYPELAKKVWLKRLAAQRQLGQRANHLCEVLVLPEPPDGAA